MYISSIRVRCIRCVRLIRSLTLRELHSIVQHRSSLRMRACIVRSKINIIHTFIDLLVFRYIKINLSLCISRVGVSLFKVGVYLLKVGVSHLKVGVSHLKVGARTLFSSRQSMTSERNRGHSASLLTCSAAMTRSMPV